MGNTEELSNFEKNDSMLNRNAFSVTKLNRPQSHSIRLTPLPLFLEDFKRQIEEAQNEPIPLLASDEEDDERNEEKVQEEATVRSKSLVKNGIESLAVVTPKTVAPPKTAPVNSKVSGKKDSKPGHNFITPARQGLHFQTKKQLIKTNNFTPKPKQVGINKCEDLATPLKVQCTINVPDSLRKSLSKNTNKENNNKELITSVFNTTIETNFEKIRVKNVEYLILNMLGKGGSSEVFHCFNYATKNHRAIKRVCLKNPLTATGYLNEVEVLEKLQHCNKIIKMYDYEIIEEEKRLIVVLEVGGADLAKTLKDLSTNGRNLPLYMIVFHWMEMLYAIKQIHSNGIVHCDLKPANFLQAESGLKLIDFGISGRVQNDMTSLVKTVSEGTFNYISPEALINDPSNNSPNKNNPKYKLSYKSDVWSLGCILYQLVYRKPPFSHYANSLAKITAIANPEHKIVYTEASWVPDKIIKTIQKCLQFDKQLRPTIDELIAEYESFPNL